MIEQRPSSAPDAALVFPSPDASALTPFSVSGAAYGNFMVAVFDEWVRQDVDNVYVQLFDATLRRWAGLPSGVCLFQEECGNCLVVERNGDIFSCDHYEYPAYRLGNIVHDRLDKLAASPAQRQFARDKGQVGTTCQRCPSLRACYGGCPKHRIHPNSDGSRQNHLCPGYRTFFHHVGPYMHYMVEQLRQGLPPGRVMAMADRIAARGEFTRFPARRDVAAGVSPGGGVPGRLPLYPASHRTSPQVCKSARLTYNSGRFSQVGVLLQ